MISKPGISRRTFNTLALASLGNVVSLPLFANIKARIVVVGGGPGGITVARRLAANEALDVVLVEPNEHYTTPFFANRHLDGSHAIDDFTFSYKSTADKSRVRIIHDLVIDGDPAGKTVRLKNGSTLNYDKLIVSPGTGLQHNDIEGYNAESETIFPHAYDGTSRDQWALLGDQLRGMDDGGLVVISAPERPYKCTPAPYERASLIAGYLSRHKPKSKILILDSKMEFPLMDAMIEVWGDRFGDLIEWVSSDFGGAVAEVDNASRSIIADGETYKPAVCNIIPPQSSASIAKALDLADESGWCPIIPETFQSARHPGIHVLGDAIEAGDMPKSASAAYQQALSASVAIKNLLLGSNDPLPELHNACYFLTEPGNGLVVGGRYEISDGEIVGIEGYSSDPGERPAIRKGTSDEADDWYSSITQTMFG